MGIRTGAIVAGGGSLIAAAAYGVKTIVANRHLITRQHIFAELVGIGCALTMGSYAFRKGVMQLNHADHENTVKNFTDPFSIAGDVFQNTAPMIVAAFPIVQRFLQAETPVLLKAGVSLGLAAGGLAVVYYVNYMPAKAGVKDEGSVLKIVNTLLKCANIYILYLAAFRQKQLDKVIGVDLIAASLASMNITAPISKDTLFRWLGFIKKEETESIDVNDE